MKRFFDQLSQTRDTTKMWNKEMDMDLRQQILQYHDEAIKKFYPII